MTHFIVRLFKTVRFKMRQINSLKMIAVYVLLIGIFYILPATKAANTTIIFYSGSTKDIYPLNEAEKVLTNKKFIKSRPVALYAHGYTGSASTDTAKAITAAYIKNGGYNFLFYDWSELADDIYPIAVSHIDGLGKEIAMFILKLVELGCPISNIHLLGHSLGAHLCGYSGRHIKSLSNNALTLPRITGLDPAGPDFFTISVNTRAISESDAEFVDIIHTDAGRLGSPVETRTGTVDFWPNDGVAPQPGCRLFSSCSHARSCFLWAESVANNKNVSFTSRRRDNNKIKVQMGNNCPVTAQPGSYYLVTNEKSPFSQG